MKLSYGMDLTVQLCKVFGLTGLPVRRLVLDMSCSTVPVVQVEIFVRPEQTSEIVEIVKRHKVKVNLSANMEQE